ncbi:hypothetical protein GALL_551270 [mine drainage metagenome]|uniref:Uncharacterized protein n=1 Tax=mine drainage metagenome TaxID=410659 RepID=A0A1J5P7A1_9ZZZZ
MANSMPMTPKFIRPAAALAPVNAGRRKKASGISGWATRPSHQTKSPPANTVAAAASRMDGAVQPSAWPSIKANNRAARHTVASACPPASSRRWISPWDSRTERAVSSNAASPTGRLIQKIARQPSASTSSPPSVGPATNATPDIPAHRPMARARRRASTKACRRMASELGSSAAAPTPCATRAALSQVRFGERAHSSEASTNTTRPMV